MTDWFGPDLNTLKVYHVIPVLLGFTEVEIHEVLAMRSVLSQTALMVMDKHRNDLSRKLDLLLFDFPDRLVGKRFTC